MLPDIWDQRKWEARRCDGYGGAAGNCRLCICRYEENRGLGGIEMMELTINGQVYQFHFGMGFLREVNKIVNAPVEGIPGMKKDIGARYMFARVIDGEADALVEVLNLANMGQDPRVTRALLDAYVDDPETDIDQLFEDTLDFLEKANATRKTVQKLMEAIRKSEEENQ